MKKIEFQNLPSTNTPISADNLNQMQSNIEESAVVVSAIQPTTNEKVWLQRSNNLFNKELANMQNKGFSSAEGNVTAETNQSRMTTVNTIRLKAGTYTISFINAGKIWILAYDLLGNYKGNGYIQSSWETTNSKTFTLEEECLIRISIANVDDSEISLDEIYNIQIERGSTATTYEEYIEPKIYVKNDNGVYEEFISKDNLENYSTAEQKIGTWIDGKPLYRKTIDFGTLPNNTAKTASLGVGDVENVISIRGTSKDTSNLCIPIPFVSASSPVTINYSISTGLITVTSTSDRTAFTKTYITIEYTKTTD